MGIIILLQMRILKLKSVGVSLLSKSEGSELSLRFPDSMSNFC